MFWCVWSVKHQHTIFHARVDSVQIPQKVSKLVMSNLYFCIWCDLLVAYYDLVRRWRETSTRNFSSSGERSAGSIKSGLQHITPNLCFSIRRDLRVM
jgi:hypothetical protein